MKAVVSHGVGDFRIEDVPMPPVYDGEVLVEIHYCGVCGTDVHQYHGHWELEVGATPGHEISGLVKEVGPQVERFAPGDRVALNPGVTCQICDFCRSGRVDLCSHRVSLYHYRRGGFAEYTVLPERQIYKLPEGLPLECGAFLEPAGACVHGIDRAEIKPGQSVAVLGGGAAGLMLMQLALLSGASKVFLIEPQEGRRRLAEELGATATINPVTDNAVEALKDLSGGGVDLAIESAGLAVTASQCLEVVKRGGRIVLFGVCDPQDRVEFSPYLVFRNELTIAGTVMIHDAFPRTLELLASQRLRVQPLISHMIPLERFQEALDMHERNEGVKLLITPRET